MNFLLKYNISEETIDKMKENNEDIKQKFAK